MPKVQASPGAVAVRFLPLLAAALLACWAGPLHAGALVAGPMAGFSARDKATIWLMSDADAQVTLDYWPADEPGRIARSRPVGATAANGRSVHIVLDGLRPVTRYRYRVRLDGQPALPDSAALSFVTQRGDARAVRDFSLATGSCAYLTG